MLQNLCAPRVDPQLKQHHFQRTREQTLSLGLNPDSAQDHREAEDTNFAALIAAKRPFGAAEEPEVEVDPTDTAAGSATPRDVQAIIEEKTENIRLGRQEVCVKARQLSLNIAIWSM